VRLDPKAELTIAIEEKREKAKAGLAGQTSSELRMSGLVN
jgi:hypothetical protein